MKYRCLSDIHRTRITHEMVSENCLGLIHIASFLMDCGVLRNWRNFVSNPSSVSSNPSSVSSNSFFHIDRKSCVNTTSIDNDII